MTLAVSSNCRCRRLNHASNRRIHHAMLRGLGTFVRRWGSIRLAHNWTRSIRSLLKHRLKSTIRRLYSIATFLQRKLTTSNNLKAKSNSFKIRLKISMDWILITKAPKLNSFTLRKIVSIMITLRWSKAVSWPSVIFSWGLSLLKNHNKSTCSKLSNLDTNKII